NLSNYNLISLIEKWYKAIALNISLSFRAEEKEIGSGRKKDNFKVYFKTN
ncbi:unnamed protein product, partial [marine sediment metagenome]